MLAVYVSNAESATVGVYELDPAGGELRHIEDAKVARSGQSMPLAVSPDRRFLYAAMRSEPYEVAAFAVDALTGRLTHLADAPIADSMAYVSTDRTGRWLLGASYPSFKLTLNPIGLTGFVQPPATVLRTEPNAHCAIADATNRFVYCTSLGGNIVMQFRFDAGSGTLTPLTPAAVRVAAGAGPRHLALHPNNRFLYLLCELDASVYVFAVDPATGALTELQTLSAQPDEPHERPSAADLHITPDGSYLYASVRASSTLTGFRVAPNGRLTRVGTWETETQPRGFNIDPFGRLLLAAGQQSHALTVYAIDAATGSLSPLHQYAMGRNPNWVEIVRLP